MRIAYLGVKGLPSKSGAERVVEALTERLRGSHQLTVYCNSRYTPVGTEVPGVHLIRIPTLPGKHLQPLSLFLLSALHAVSRGDFDVVHLHNAEACFVAPLLRLRYPVVATSHGPAYARQKWGPLDKRLIQLSDYFYSRFAVVCTSVSAPLAQEYERRFKREIRYVPNGVDEVLPLDEDMAAAALDPHGITSDYILFAAGRLDPTKGCHTLLKAFGSLNSGIPLVIVGDWTVVPSYGQQLQHMADERVKFVPFIDSKGALFSIFKRARFLVFPSTVEAMSMVLLEAASLGVPLVCSDIPENTTVLGDRALFFEAENSSDLSDKLQWAVSHPETMRGLGESARAWVRHAYSWDSVAHQYDTLYGSLLTEV